VVRRTIVSNIAQAETLVAALEETVSVLLARVLQHWSALRALPASGTPKLVLSKAGSFAGLARFYLVEVVHGGTGPIRRLLRRGIRPVDIDHAVFCIVGPMIMSRLWRESFEQYDNHAPDAEASHRVHLDLLLRDLVPVCRGAAEAERLPRRHNGAAQ
jgi:hypothetical protein